MDRKSKRGTTPERASMFQQPILQPKEVPPLPSQVSTTCQLVSAIVSIADVLMTVKPCTWVLVGSISTWVDD